MKKILLSLVLILPTVLYANENLWKTYYQKTLYLPVNPLIQKVIKEHDQTGTQKIAIDLGSGVGNETAYLLQKGWQVWSIDAEKTAMKANKSGEKIPSPIFEVIANKI